MWQRCVDNFGNIVSGDGPVYNVTILIKIVTKGAWPVRERVRTFLVSRQEALSTNTTVLPTPDPTYFFAF